MSLSDLTRRELTDLADRLDPDAAHTIRAALREDADDRDDDQDDGAAVDPRALASSVYADMRAEGSTPRVAAVHARNAAAILQAARSREERTP